VDRRPQVAVAGGGADLPRRLRAAAEEVGEGLAAAGFTIVCGGLGGVMEAAARGARRGGGDVLAVLPGDDPGAANPYCTHVVATGIGHARNLAVVASARAVVVIGGEWGTLSEIGFARRLGRPVVALETWTVEGVGPIAGAPGIEAVDDPAAAVTAVSRVLA